MSCPPLTRLVTPDPPKLLDPERVSVPVPPAPLTVRPAVPPMLAALVTLKVPASIVLLELMVTEMLVSMKLALEAEAFRMPPLKITWFVVNELPEFVVIPVVIRVPPLSTTWLVPDPALVLVPLPI